MAEQKKKANNIAHTIVEHCRKHDTGVLLLVLENDCQLRIYINNGELAHAQCQQFKGMAALKLLQQFKATSYRFYPGAKTLLKSTFPPMDKLFKSVKRVPPKPKKEVYYPL